MTLACCQANSGVISQKSGTKTSFCVFDTFLDEKDVEGQGEPSYSNWLENFVI